MKNYTELPPDLPIPVDDGATNHLLGKRLPNIFLKSARGDSIDLGSIKGKVVVYCYPMTDVFLRYIDVNNEHHFC